MFNDDIQSTAVLASLYGANAKFFIVDKDGLITKGRHNLEEREEQAVDILISKSCYERQCFNWWLSFAARDLYSIQTGWISLLTDISDIVRTRLDVKY